MRSRRLLALRAVIGEGTTSRAMGRSKAHYEATGSTKMRRDSMSSRSIEELDIQELYESDHLLDHLHVEHTKTEEEASQESPKEDTGTERGE